MTNSEIIWRPYGDYIEKSNITRFMRAHGIKDYDELIRRSTADIAWFWDAALKDLGVEWYQPYAKPLEGGLPFAKWFVGGKLNLIHNVLDRHFVKHGHKPAFIWESDDNKTRTMTYAQLNDAVTKAASALKSLGIAKGDRIGLYMPMIPEMVVAFLATLKVGAVIIPVFSGFGAQALATRLNDAQAKLLFTADGSLRRGKEVEIKKAADEAVKDCPTVKNVVVAKRLGSDVSWRLDRDHSWDDFLARGSKPVETEKTEAEDTSLIIYTSGTTGKPKGTVHTHAGCQAQMAKELGYAFDVKPNDVFFWVTDIGWMMGPWEILGVLTFCATFVIFEGAPDWPRPDRLWEVVENHRVTHLGISPTAVRLLIKSGIEWPKRHDLSSLRILGSTGETWDPESYQWFFEHIGGKRCPIMNISGGTEIVGCHLSPLPITPLKSCTLRGPGLGMDVDVWNEEGKSVRGEVGYLVCKKPAPSMTKGFLNDPQRYLDTYFSKWPNVWNHGDWAYVDEDGFWFLKGRADDTIKVAGRRTGPAEIEAVLLEHPAVSEAAVIGVPHEVKGEEVVCFVVLKPSHRPGEPLRQELKDQVVKGMGKTLAPKDVRFVKMLPKTRSAKIVRGAIKKKYLGQPLGDVSSVENMDALEEIGRSV
ncbi:MAG TPA: AMP-binding protein [bacterium]|nr:AMP-binding protein [bacterium]